jgi:hypothetical protein
MTTRLYVHVGPHKTGTTFVQQVMERNREVLDDQGVLFLGRRYSEQREAVLELLRRSRRDDFDPAEPPPGWNGLMDDLRRWDGDRAIISVENLDRADAPAVECVVRSSAPAEVHVVYTARDVTQVIPAMWHTLMRNKKSQTWADFIAGVRAAEDTATWPAELRGQDPRRVLGLWEHYVPRERIHVITVPRPGSDQSVLWERFCSVVGLKPDEFSLDLPRTNKSLGTAETELLRRVNQKVGRRLSRRGYDRWVQVFVARRVLEKRADQLKFALPPEDHAWVRRYADDFIDFLRESGYEVTGDLDELTPGEPRASAVPPDAATDAQVLDAAVDSLAALLLKIDRMEQERQTTATAVFGARLSAGRERVRALAVRWRSRRARTSRR